MAEALAKDVNVADVLMMFTEHAARCWYRSEFIVLALWVGEFATAVEEARQGMGHQDRSDVTVQPQG
jgi:uncharacterized protein YfaA (DUF2138 family)